MKGQAFDLTINWISTV